VTFELMLAEKAHYPIRVMARVLGVTASGYYTWRGRPLITPQIRRNAALRRRIRLIHAESRGTYGSPRVLRALRDAGERVGRNRIIRAMRRERLTGKPRRRFRVTTQADPAAVPAPNRLARQFAVDGPNRVWAGDLTALPTAQGWLYLAVLLDLWSRRVVGWAVRATLETEVVLAAWHMAVGRRQTAPHLHHSDRGCQYTSDAYQRLLSRHNVVCSMSRRGDCWDNAPVESFFRTLKVELIPDVQWPTRAIAAAAVHDYIERFYNTTRLHSSLHYCAPAVFEARRQVA
jgi:putative transposase